MKSLQCLSLQLLIFFYLLSHIFICCFYKINSLNNPYLFTSCGILLEYFNVLNIVRTSKTSPIQCFHIYVTLGLIITKQCNNNRIQFATVHFTALLPRLKQPASTQTHSLVQQTLSMRHTFFPQSKRKMTPALQLCPPSIQATTGLVEFCN